MATAMAASTCTTRCLTRWRPPPTTCASKRRAKWTMGLLTVVEVRLPAELAATIPPEPDAEYVGAKDRRTIAQWVQAGVKQGNGAALKLSSGEGEQAYLFAPTGSRGPVFLATVNFDAILHYNQSRRYALAVALLLNRLQDRPGLATPWPTDDPGLSRADQGAAGHAVRLRP
ncbi:lytic murein transglycosylase [Achromobacter xylosoxidans]